MLAPNGRGRDVPHPVPDLVSMAVGVGCGPASVIASLNFDRTIRGHNDVSKVIWRAEPDAHDYPAPASYLSLVASSAQVSDLIEALKAATCRALQGPDKDMLRASGLALLTPDNRHVAADLAKVHNNKALSPVLLIRGDLTAGVALQIADGYHRVCASYHLDENTDIHCRIANHPGHPPNAATH